MKFLSLAAFVCLGLSAQAATISGGTKDSQQQMDVASAPTSDVLQTRESADGKIFQVQEPDGSWKTLDVKQASENMFSVTDGKEQGQLIASDSTQAKQDCTGNDCMQLAWWGGWHHRGWEHFGWHHRWWHHHHDGWYGGWHHRWWHRWHRVW